MNYLEKVRVNTPVPFNGPTDAVLLGRHGTLALTDDGQFIICRPDAKPGYEIHVPMHNVASFEVMSPAHAEKYLSERDARERAKAEVVARGAMLKAAALAKAAKPAPAQDDTIVYVKDENGNIVQKKPDVFASIESASAADAE